MLKNRASRNAVNPYAGMILDADNAGHFGSMARLKLEHRRDLPSGSNMSVKIWVTGHGRQQAAACFQLVRQAGRTSEVFV